MARSPAGSPAAPNIAAVLSGDRAAARALVIQMTPRVRNLVRYRVRDDDDVDDIAQEAMVAVLIGDRRRVCRVGRSRQPDCEAPPSSFVNVVPAHQYLNSYSFYADSTFPQNSLVIVRKKTNGSCKDVWLECAGDLQTFKPVDTRGEYEYTRVDLSRDFGPGDKFGDSRCITGLQRLRSEGAFTATIWGWGFATSYGYPGGVAIRKLVDTPLAVVK